MVNAHSSSPSQDPKPGAAGRWQSGSSIYAHLFQHLDPETGKILPSGHSLPDEARRLGVEQEPWGFWGGFSDPKLQQQISQITQLLLQVAHGASDPAQAQLYQVFLQDKNLVLIDAVLKRIQAAGVASYSNLRAYARSVIQTASDRGPVKFALALIGLCGDPADLELVDFMGRHDEFTRFSMVALDAMLDDPELAFWELAQKVEGPGRIDTLWSLVNTQNPEIKAWLLRDGFKSLLLDEEIAYLCAVGGDLRSALNAPQLDDELLLNAGAILKALIQGGLAGEDISVYADAAEVTLRYLHLVDERTWAVKQYLAVEAILGYLTQEWEGEANAKNGWEASKREQAIAMAQAILQKPCWPEIAGQALQSPEGQDFFEASELVESLRYDAWEWYWGRLQAEPLHSGCWFGVMHGANPERIDAILDFALRVLPLEQIATGPERSWGGSGPEFQPHRCLGYILQHLKRFPGRGWPLLAVGLHSPVISDRSTVLTTLKAWGRDQWPQGVEQVVSAAAVIEPDPYLKESLQKLLRQ